MTAPDLRVVASLNHRDPQADPVRKLLRGSLLVVETGVTNAGLPTPIQVLTDDHAVQLTLDTEDAFNAWAIWLEAAVDPYRIDTETIYYSARATVLGVPVVVEFRDMAAGWVS